ncbi:glycosyl hydrolase family 28-related protein [Paraburkholderia sp. BL10I2N1]|uniref:glycosyl hydrolase family 28-related protein n=1 Tax=Paraburkholderia sp. BL10I2N1 TaxID=1938796 RepID=UPI00105F6BBD|nr:glycosyl hydrolase family 28-related protein [Paraburkholderia sp. BL10I2N1]TDN70409.1 pectate lyase-like protein [Paraburkholderia sp. BL10I2N1]
MTDTVQQALATFQTDVALAHSIVHGDATTTVTTNGGPVRSFAKLEADNQTTFSALGAGTNSDAGTLTGSVIVPVTRGAGLLQTTLSTLAQWLLGSFLGIAQGTSGTLARTAQGKFADMLSVKDFGAKGDGVTDDTAAFQLAMNALVAGPTQGLYVPDGNYILSAPLTLGANNTSVFTGIRITGQSRGGTILTQTGSNMPIFHLTGLAIHTLVWASMQIIYSTMQTGNTASAVFQVDGPSNGSIFNCVFTDLWSRNFYYFTNAPTIQWWGNTYRDMWLGDFAGGVNNISGAAGKPNNRFERMYISCQSATQVLFNHNSVVATYDGVEVNAANSGAAMIYDGGGGVHLIEHFALEVATYNANTVLFNVPNGVLLASAVYTNTLTIGAGVTVTTFQAAANHSYFDVKNYRIDSFAANNGTLLICSTPGPLTSRIGVVDVPFSTTCKLCDNVASMTADYIAVDSWNDPSRMQMNVDTSVTVAYGDPLHQVFDAPLTAARVVTLPEHRGVTANQLFSGRRYRFTKTNTSAYTLTINSITGATVATIAAGSKGVVEVAWHREASGGANWVLMDNRTYS